MITVRQIRAARALLNLPQTALAQKAGISVTSLSAIEREQKTPRTKTLQSLQNALEAEGIAFTKGDGVRFKEEVFDIKIYQKTQAASIEYHQDILSTLKRDGGIFYAFSNSDTYDDEALRKIQFRYFQDMVKYGYQERIILPENNVNCYGPASVSQYRTLPKDLFGQMETSLYGNKFVINEPKRVIVVHSSVISEAFQKQFSFYWRMAQPIPKNTPRFFDSDRKKWDT